MAVQTSLPEWAQWVQAIGPLITAAATVGIGVIVAFIAWRQHRTAHEKLILDLFEKRLAIYQRVDEQVRKLVDPGNLVAMNISNELLRIMAQGRFLFGDEVIQKLDVLRQEIPEAHLAYSSYYDDQGKLNDVERDAMIDRYMKKLTAWRNACLPYMRLAQKL